MMNMIRNKYKINNILVHRNDSDVFCQEKRQETSYIKTVRDGGIEIKAMYFNLPRIN